MNTSIPPCSHKYRVVSVVGILCLLATFAGNLFVGAQNDSPTGLTTPAGPAIDSSTTARVAEHFGNLPLSFEINQGQSDRSVKFLSRGPGYELFLTGTDAVLTLRKPDASSSGQLERPAAPGSKPEEQAREGVVLRLRMLGAGPVRRVAGRDQLPGKVNYFAGNNPDQWLRNIPTYRKVHFTDVYPGIDMVYYGNQRELEYDFVVAAGANPKLIRFRVEGAERVRLDKSGALRLTLKFGEVRLQKPLLYQLDGVGNRREIKGEYVVEGNDVRFKVQAFDSRRPLVIDPVLSYATFLGGSAGDEAFGIAVDGQGSAYVTGRAALFGFPTTPGAFKTTTQSDGVFVSKLNPTGSNLVYSTFLVGVGISVGTSIAVDSSGNAHVTGSTSAQDFPIVNGLKSTSNFFKTSDAAANWNNNNTGLVDSVSKIALAQSAPNIIYAAVPSGIHRSTDAGATWTKTPSAGLTVFGFVTALAVDPSNSSVVYLCPTNGSLFKSTDGGNNWGLISTIPLSASSVFSIVFDPATPSTMYVGAGNGVFKSIDSGATWSAQNNFGLANPPNIRSLAIDPATPATIYAGTLSNGLFKSTNGGANWVAMNNGMGGNSPNSITTVVIDPSNPATVYTGHGSQGGINKSTNGGTSWTPVNNGVPSLQVNAMVATASAVYAATAGGGLLKTTDGGTNWTGANAGLGSSQVQALAGHPSDSSILYAGTSPSIFTDAFVTKLNAAGSGLLFSTLLGGSMEESGNGIALDASGNIFVVGNTTSNNFPALNAIQPTGSASGSCGNGFVTKINPAVPSYVFSTYLGGNGCDSANGVTTDASGNAYVTGTTSSTDFPIANAFQPAISPGQSNSEAFVTKLNAGGALSYSTYLGGNGADTGHAIAVDVSGSAYVTGVTASTNFPTLNPIQQGTITGPSGDVFVTKLNAGGNGLVYSTYLSAGSTDIGRGIATDSAGNAYVTGFTNSVDFPITQGTLRTKSSLYKSINTGGNWTNDNYGLTSSVLTLAVHPTLPSTLYAGTTSGVFRSTNGGRNWSLINNGLGNIFIIALLIDPLTPSNIYALGNSNTGHQGVWKSTDGGNSWNLRVNGMGSTFLISLAIDPISPNILYAGFLGGTGGRIYKTTNGADNWTQVGNEELSRPVSLAVDPHNHTTVYAAESSSAGGVFKSVDSGITWQPVGLNQTGANARFVIASPHTPGLLYTAINNVGIFKSVDGGANWSNVSVPRGGNLMFDPVSPTTIYLLSSFDGLFRSADLGQTWTALNKDRATLTTSAFAIDPLKSSTLYLATTISFANDAFVTKINSAGSAIVYSTFVGGVSPSGSSPIANSLAFAIAIDSADSVYIAGMASAEMFFTTPDAFQPLMRGGRDAFIAKLANSYFISGHVRDGSSAPVSGAEVVLNDGGVLTSLVTETDGSYEFSRVREGKTVTVTASKPHFTMAPTSQTFNNLSSNQTLNFTATATSAPFHTISGQITDNGSGLTGVTVTLSGSQPGLRTTDSNGNYSFEVPAGGNYTVTPAALGFTFGPTSQTFNNLGTAQTANFAATRQNFVVTNANNHGTGSLREAMVNANATPGLDTITFNIPGPGVKVISLLNALPEITDPVVIDATTQPGFAGTPLIDLDGSQVSNTTAFLVTAGGTTVRGFAMGGFSPGAIVLRDCNNNVVQGNYIGVDASGSVRRFNDRGILLANSSNNLIGGTTAAARNIISGSLSNAIDVVGTNNLIQGNFIGTNAAGTEAIPNGAGGIVIQGSNFTDNVIGGSTPGAGNLISGNPRGILSTASGTVIQGNLIGTDVTGTKTIPNGVGVDAGGANTLIGGLTVSARNVISGNGSGVIFGGNGSKVQGNYIGTDITGTLPLGNTIVGVSTGNTAAFNPSNTLIGGTVPEARNVISANLVGISLAATAINPGATVQGNYIGTDANGNRALGNTNAGISIQGVNHLIGGTAPGSGNVISGNQIGIQISNTFVTPQQGSTVQGNLIGLNALGTAPLPNTVRGIDLPNATNNTIGGLQSGAANTIAFNGGTGVHVFSGTGNSIRGNSIFSNNGLGIDLGNLAPQGSSGVTPNDPNDTDSGPNNLQNFPVLTSITSVGSSTTIQGTLNSTPNTTFQIDFYTSAALDPSGNGEGAQFFNTTAVTTGANGNATINASFPVALAPGRVVTATATDPSGNTSEFSAGDATGASGSVHFSVGSMQVIEDVGLLTVTVLRTGGSAGTLSVDFATANDTAIAGQDYTATSGTLTFSGGETSRTFQIPIIDDAVNETDETFTVALFNAPGVEFLGFPSTLKVTIQDRSTVPFFVISDASVTEGGPGTTTQMTFTVTLSAATGRTVSVNFGTSNTTAFGGASCNTRGVDYVSTSGTATVQPGTTSVTIPVSVCGDTNAEANETFLVILSNAVNATILDTVGVGAILNDDVLQLVFEENGPVPDQAAALDALFFLRDPFRVVGIPEWWPTTTDRNTRVILFARNLELNPGESPAAIIVRITGNGPQFFDVPAEEVRPIHDFEFTQVVFRLPNNLPVGTRTVTIRAHGMFSNSGTIRIAP